MSGSSGCKFETCTPVPFFTSTTSENNQVSEYGRLDMSVVNSCDYFVFSVYFFQNKYYYDRESYGGLREFLLDDGSTLLCETTSWSYSYYRPSRPLPRGGLGDVTFLGATGETDGTLPSTRARNLACYPYATHM